LLEVLEMLEMMEMMEATRSVPDVCLKICRIKFMNFLSSDSNTTGHEFLALRLTSRL